jgi:hypothetical protein
MPSGDAQRIWFPEMAGRLRAEWHDGMSMSELVSLRDELNAMLHQIRAGRKIRTPIITCPKCGMTAPATEPQISVRAMILALNRFGIASKDQTRTLEGAWLAYRRQHQLDTEGKLSAEVSRSCPH